MEFLKGFLYICLCGLQKVLVASSPGEVLQLNFPDVAIAAQDNGTFVGQSGKNGDIYIQPPNNTGGIYFDGYDLRTIIDIINNMPPVWKLESEVGYSGTFEGGSDVDILLEVLDPENEGVRFELAAGDFPPGLNITSHPWKIHGIAPDVNAIFSFTIRAFDERDKYADAVFKIQTMEADQCLLNPCNNSGHCNNTNTHRGFVCLCPDEYGGPTCDVVCNETVVGVEKASIIPNAQMAAYLSRGGSKATDGRLVETGPAWCGENDHSWLQIDLGRPVKVFRLLTAGANSTFFTKTYTVSYSTDGSSFDFVTDTNSTNKHRQNVAIGVHETGKNASTLDAVNIPTTYPEVLGSFQSKTSLFASLTLSDPCDTRIGQSVFLDDDVTEEVSNTIFNDFGMSQHGNAQLRNFLWIHWIHFSITSNANLRQVRAVSSSDLRNRPPSLSKSGNVRLLVLKWFYG